MVLRVQSRGAENPSDVVFWNPRKWGFPGGGASNWDPSAKLSQRSHHFAAFGSGKIDHLQIVAHREISRLTAFFHQPTQMGPGDGHRIPRVRESIADRKAGNQGFPGPTIRIEANITGLLQGSEEPVYC